MRDNKGRFVKGNISWSKLNHDKMPHGLENASWKGNKVGYRALHNWIEKLKGKANFCSFNINHMSKRFHWANISGSYIRDINDYVSLCPQCHKQYDSIRRGRHYV